MAILRVTASTDAINEVPLFAAEDVSRRGFMRRGLDSLVYFATRWMR